MAKVRVAKNDPVKKRLLKYLGNAYQSSDEEIIDLYVETYRFYQKMREEMEASEMLIDHTNKFGATNQTKNPLIIEISKTVQTLNNLLKSMGMTPAQRKSIVSENSSGDEFEKY